MNRSLRRSWSRSRALTLAASVLVGLAGSAAHADPAAAPKADTKTETKPANEAKPASDTKPADDTKPNEKKTRSKAEIEAFLTKCSQEADEKGLDVKKGKGAERKAFRRQCMRKFGVEPR